MFNCAVEGGCLRARSQRGFHTLVGSVVTVKTDPLRGTLEIFSKTERVAAHPLITRGQRDL